MNKIGIYYSVYIIINGEVVWTQRGKIFRNSSLT